MASAIAAGLLVTLAALAGLHLYWGLGGYWPGTDEATLVERVVGRTQGMEMPGLFACFAVAACLAAAAGLVAVRAGVILAPLSATPVVRLGLLAAALVFLLRGGAGFLPPVFAYAEGTPFQQLNTMFYSPLCLAIAAGMVAVDRLALASPDSGL